jgi:uncharacterized protein YoxC
MPVRDSGHYCFIHNIVFQEVEVSKKESEDILVALAELKKDTEYSIARLDKINGSLNDYPAKMEKLNQVCKKVDDIDSDIEKNVKPPITKLTIKVYSAAVITGLFSGGIGSLIGYFIARLFIQTFGGNI